MFVSIAAGKTHLRVPFLSMLEGRKEGSCGVERGREIGGMDPYVHSHKLQGCKQFFPAYICVYELDPDPRFLSIFWQGHVICPLILRGQETEQYSKVSNLFGLL